MEQYEEESHKGRNYLSAGISLGIHALLILLLSFLTMKAVSPELRDDGIPVILDTELEEEEEVEEPEKEEEPEPEKVKPPVQKIISPEVNGPDEGLGSPSNSGEKAHASGADMKTPPKAEPAPAAPVAPAPAPAPPVFFFSFFFFSRWLLPAPSVKKNHGFS